MIVTNSQAVVTGNTTAVIYLLGLYLDAFCLADTGATTAFGTVVLIEDDFKN
jgi:hypothetical protein